jgi:hypothetical protein
MSSEKRARTRLVLIAMLLYCLLASIWLVVQLVETYGRQSQLSVRQVELHAELNAAAQRLHTRERMLALSREQQRAERAGLAGDEAIEASTEVQLALAEFEQATLAHEEQTLALEAVSDELTRQRLRFVPLGVTLLIHVVLGLILLPHGRPPRR